MKTKITAKVRDLGAVGRKTRAQVNQRIYDGGTIPPFVSQPLPNVGGEC